MRNAILGSLTALLLAMPAAAQQQPAQPAAPVTGDSIDRGLINLGMMTAHAFQCTPEAQRAEFQRMVLAFNAILLADMGGNAAFRYASAFGAGTARDVDRAFCERSLADWQRHVQANRLAR